MRYKFRKHPSKLATLMVTFGAGSRVEFGTDYPIGIAHYMEHVRFKGTQERSAKDLLRITADAGGSWNAFTSNNMVSYHMSIPEENLETAFDCLSDVVLNPTFPQEELTKEQGVVCQEIRMYNDQIESLVDDKLMEIVFDNSMINPICGTEESVRSITKQHLLDFSKEFYSKEHMLITLGASDDHQHLVEKYFGIPDDVLLFSAPDNKIEYKPSVNEKVFKEGQLQDCISIAFCNDYILSLGNEKRAVAKIFSTIFGSGDTSRLWMKIREDLGLVYGVGSYLMNNMDGALYEIYASTEPKNTELLIESVNKEIKEFLKGPSEEELNRAKNIIKSQVYRVLDTSYGSTSQMLSEEFRGYQTNSKFLADVNGVTTENVREVAENIFNGTRYIVIGTGKQ